MSTMRGTTPFDAERALREEIEGLNGVRSTLVTQGATSRERAG
jgi:hypothetical protein